MSLIFFDGFDYTGAGAIGPGGRKYDQGSGGNAYPGRFGGQAFQTSGVLTKTLSSSYSSLIVGWAMNVGNFFGNWIGSPVLIYPFFTFWDHNVPQCSLWIDHETQVLKLMSGNGTLITDVPILMTGYVPPLTLWYYFECKLDFSTGTAEMRVNGTTIASIPGAVLQQSGNGYINKFSFSPFSSPGGGIQWGSWLADDFYVIDPTDGVGNCDFLGEVRVQTKYPDAEGYQNDFLPSQGTNNANNVNATTTSYSETGLYNYSGAVGAIDLYSIGNFTVSGKIFAVQESISFRKDDVGNRNVACALRSDTSEFFSPSSPCYSTYTYAGMMWEQNPVTQTASYQTDGTWLYPVAGTSVKVWRNTALQHLGTDYTLDSVAAKIIPVGTWEEPSKGQVSTDIGLGRSLGTRTVMGWPKLSTLSAATTAPGLSKPACPI